LEKERGGIDAAALVFFFFLPPIYYCYQAASKAGLLAIWYAGVTSGTWLIVRWWSIKARLRLRLRLRLLLTSGGTGQTAQTRTNGRAGQGAARLVTDDCSCNAAEQSAAFRVGGLGVAHVWVLRAAS
jgi:hypothetical protein